MQIILYSIFSCFGQYIGAKNKYTTKPQIAGIIAVIPDKKIIITSNIPRMYFSPVPMNGELTFGKRRI